jgi:hypothetical protein
MIDGVTKVVVEVEDEERARASRTVTLGRRWTQSHKAAAVDLGV